MRRRTSDLGSHSASWTPAAPASALIASPAASKPGCHCCRAAQQRGGKDGLIAYRCATTRVQQHLHYRLQRAAAQTCEFVTRAGANSWWVSEGVLAVARVH